MNIVHHKVLPVTSDAQKLQSVLEQVTVARRLEAIETKLETLSISNQRYNPQQLAMVSKTAVSTK